MTLHVVVEKQMSMSIKVEIYIIHVVKDEIVKGSRTGYFVKVSLWYASLLTTIYFAFFISE